MRRRVAEVMVIVGLCVMAVTAMAGAQDPLPDAGPVPTVTPEPTPEATPEPTPQATPEATPEQAPEPTPAPPPPVEAQAAPAEEEAEADAPPEITAAPRQAAPPDVTFCHATGSATEPYVAITLPEGALLGHDAHPGDLIPAPAGGCPAAPQAPAPAPSPAPTAPPAPAPRDEVTICHATSSGTFVELTVSERGAAGHRRHARDLVPAPEGGCPSRAATPAPAPPAQPPVPAATPEPPGGEVLDDSQSGSAPAPSRTPPAPTPAPAVSAAPAARGQGAELAYTGFEARLIGVLGLGMAMAGAGLFLVTAEPPRPR